MLNHTYTSVKNANLVDCGKREPISSQPFPLLRDNYLGEYRTELDKKRVLANLGIATELSLEWEYIKGDIGRSVALMNELDTRTRYTSLVDGFTKSIIDGLHYVETVVNKNQSAEDLQNNRLTLLESTSQELISDLSDLKSYIEDTVDINIEELQSNLQQISDKVENITELIKVSVKEGNALTLITDSETQGLYVPDLSGQVTQQGENIQQLQNDVQGIFNTYVTKEELGGGDFDFVDQDDFDSYVQTTNTSIQDIKTELSKTVKTGEDGHVDTLFVNKISKNNDDAHIQITDSFEVDSGIPLDIRFVVENTDELRALSYKVCYPGMGVIVNSLSALYILRKPDDQTLFDQEYVSNIYNWKCPEDLVTVALTREQYEALEEINPNVFYYIFEEEIQRTREPQPEDFESTTEYEQAFNEWVNSLKTLSQEYMSASWGVDIENKLSSKATQDAVNTLSSSIKDLQNQIDSLSGGDSQNSLSGLANRLTQTESDLDFLLGTESTDQEPSSQGKISEIEGSIESLDQKLVEQYVTKESITSGEDDTEYIFVKKSEYSQDKSAFQQSLQESLETNLVKTTQITLSDLPMTSNGSSLLLNEKEVALVEVVPKIEYLTQTQYDALAKEGTLDESTYYYTTSEEIYVTQSKLEEKFISLNSSIDALSASIIAIQSRLDSLEKFHLSN